MNRRTPVFSVLPAGQAFAHDGGKQRFNEAITQLVANGDLWELHEALVPMVKKGQLEQSEEALRIELTQERFGNLVAFKIGNSPRRFWCWEGALR